MLSYNKNWNDVALRKESVDRNTALPPRLAKRPVALRKESVDRNSVGIHRFADVLVALRKESVDRNNAACIPARPASKSLSARRAWIEISHSCIIMDKLTSLSARRAWIEILWQKQKMQLLQVALRKESVDRNITIITICTASRSRSPQGERG